MPWKTKIHFNIWIFFRFPYYFYPYRNDDGYISPLISVHFESPKKNININVECIAWADNIIYHGGERDRQGSIHFELLID